ncbi:MAG: CPBP family intramembrane metalloprotease [Gammaproteobacteria bacterium]|jgi:uncharacterized protein|nr:CPBP family intramembrane metalloprotease [Gammaproteobacteria bacterium]
MSGIIKKYPFISYVLLAYGFTWSFAIPLTLSKRGIVGIELPHALEMIAAFGPFIAALLIAKTLDGSDGVERILNSLKQWRVSRVWLLFSIFSPVVLLFIAVIISWLGSGEQPQFNTEKSLYYLTLIGLFELIVVGGMIQGFGEEPGWRGFAIPWLRKARGPLLASLALFPCWLFWHLPQFLGRPEFGLAQFLGFAAGIFAATMWLTLIHDKTQSILMAALWHTTVNIARNIALAISLPMFLTFNTLIMLGGIGIVVYWVVNRPQEA